MLRKAGERTVSGLWSLIGKLVDLFQPQECANYFSSCGYDLDRQENALEVEAQACGVLAADHVVELPSSHELVAGEGRILVEHIGDHAE